MEFKKATLEEVSSKPSLEPKTVGAPIVVQINPASLRLQMANNVDAGKAFARSATQYQGSSSSTLSFDLMFDTADEGTTEEPVDVRIRTRQLERFLLPSTESPKSVPPRVRFMYGTLTVVGVMTTLNQDFDLFAANGVPLRAKCAVTIKEQKPEFDANIAGPGANTGLGATPPVPPAGTPGGAADASAGTPPGPPPPPPDRTGTALEGESASDFANRMGLDPRVWKGLAASLADPLRLEAGLQIDFSASLSLDAGLGVQAGATGALGGPSGRGAPPASAPPPAPVPAQAPADRQALTAAGGLTRALDRDAAARASAAAAHTRASFPPSGLALAPAAGSPAPPAAAVTADPRAISYGFGVPLRPHRAAVQAAAMGLVSERPRDVAADPTYGVPQSDDPTVPRWIALPPSGAGGGAAGPVRGRCACGGTR